VIAAALGAALLMASVSRAQQTVAPAAKANMELTALDYFQIQQLVAKYAKFIDTCSNNGYDYADLYTPDGEFVDNITEEGFKKGGLMRAKGREQLAAAAGAETVQNHPAGSCSGRDRLDRRQDRNPGRTFRTDRRSGVDSGACRRLSSVQRLRRERDL
jgi:hypothetical protein